MAYSTPIQYSCLENPMDGGTWWAAVHGVAKSWTRLSDSLSLFTFMHWRRKWQSTPVFLPGESQGWGSLVGCRLWGCTELDQLKWLSSSSSNIPLWCVCMCVCVCVCVYIYTYVLAIVNSAAMNIEVHVSFKIMTLSGYVPRSGIAESYSNSIFSFLSKLLGCFP